MKINIDLKDDAELRAHIKDMVKGQVTAIAREELKGMVKETLEGKIKGSEKDIFTSEAKHIISDFFNHNWQQGEGYRVIKEEIKSQVNEAITKLFSSKNAIG